MKIASLKSFWVWLVGSAGIAGVILAGSLFGSLGAATVYTAHYAQMFSYLSDNPRACINCHIMNEQYNSWKSSPHATRATCNDCHVPHDSIFSKYYVKAEDGLRHSVKFTLQNFHEPIMLPKGARNIVNDNCVRCHDQMTHQLRVETRHARDGFSGGVNCVHCHASVAHGPTR